MRKIIVCLFLFVAPLLAQSRFNGAAAGATGPAFEASLGFVYFSLAMPTQRVGLTGMDGSGQVKFSSRWAVTVDSTYARTGNILGTGHSASVMDFLAGPVFYPFVFRNSDIFVEALGGASRVNSAAPVSGSSSYLAGWVTRPSFAIGGGVERALFGQVAARVQGDYQRTTSGYAANAIQGQNNMRLTTSIVYRFGGSE
jgi:hypothetical protein